MMNPYISWAIVLVVAGSLGWYYSESNTKPKNVAKPILEKQEPAPSAKKQKRKAKKTAEPSPAPVVEKPTIEFKAPEDDVADEEIDQKEMAKRFAAVKNGTSSAQFAGGESKSQKKKKSKAAAAAPGQLEPERSASRVSTRTSSTTGADADDDLSSNGSPQVNPTSAGYVSDMLEAPAPGASVLRVTGSIDSNAQKKKTKTQNFKEVETKKQRQQRLKNEARKEEVKAAEEERRKLLEKQLHGAREAERRESAKSAATVPKTNAWQKKETQPSNGVSQPQQAPKVELLDTFEPTSTNSKSSDAPQQWNQGLPSEEEQMRILGANGEDAWTTVGTKKPKKKAGMTDESEASASESQPAPVLAPTPVEPKVKVTPTYLPDILRSDKKGHPLDSDWAA